MQDRLSHSVVAVETVRLSGRPASPKSGEFEEVIMVPKRVGIAEMGGGIETVPPNDYGTNLGREEEKDSYR